MADRTRVDVLALEDFHRNLTGRLAEVDAAIRKLDKDMGGQQPALGTFADARAGVNSYDRLHQQHLNRLRQLRTAITAAQSATGTILDNYQSAEARNRASAADIAGLLGGVGSALGETGGPNVA